MQVTIQELGAIGEMVGGIAVVVSLLYLAIQIRQNTRAIRSSSFHGVTDSFNQINNLLAHDEALARIFRIGLEDLEALSDDERIRFSFMFMSPFRVFETIYFQRTSGTVDPRLWDAEKRSMQFLLSGPGSRAWWHANPLSFTAEFRSFIEQEILPAASGDAPRRAPVDPTATDPS